MPLYQFQCANCLAVHEEFRPMAASHDPVNCYCGLMAHRIFTAPQIRTANTFLADMKLGGAQFGGANREFYLEAAREAGVNPEGKVYDSRIAAFPGDPEAWVGSKDEVRAILEKRNWACDGDMKVKCEPVAPMADVPIADDLVEDLVEARLVEQLGEDFTEASGAVVERAREDVLNTHVRSA